MGPLELHRRDIAAAKRDLARVTCETEAAPLPDGTDVFECLPDDLLLLVLVLLPMRDLVCGAGCVARRWARLCKAPRLVSLHRWEKGFVDFAAARIPSLDMIGHAGEVWGLAATADTVFSGSDDETVRCWSHADGRLLSILRGHTGPVNALSVSAGGDQLYSASDDGTIKVWRKTAAGTWNAEGVVTLSGHDGWVLSLAPSPFSGNALYSGSSDLTVGVWDITAATQRARFDTGHAEAIEALAISAEERLLFTGSGDATIRCWCVL